MPQSNLEHQFITLWQSLFPNVQLESEVQLIPKRRFRFDFVHRLSKVAIEINGGNWANGRHTRASALLSEYEKINLAQLEDYQVFLLNNEMITEEWITFIAKQIKIRVIQNELNPNPFYVDNDKIFMGYKHESIKH
jgi:hypothetical protein